MLDTYKNRRTRGLDLPEIATGDISLIVKSIVDAGTSFSSIVFVRTRFVVRLTGELDGDVGSTRDHKHSIFITVADFLTSNGLTTFNRSIQSPISATVDVLPAFLMPTVTRHGPSLCFVRPLAALALSTSSVSIFSTLSYT